MTDEKPDYQENKEPSGDLSRRDFVAMSVAAGMIAATGTASAAEAVTETNVQIKTPDGTCDAAYIHPVSGSHPGVVIWADAFGLRPAMRDIGKRIAAEGYSVLVPNPFYRVTKAPGVVITHFSFQNQADMQKLQGLMGPLNAPGGEYAAAASGSCSAVNPAGNNTQLQVTLRFNLILITPVISQATADHIILRAASVFSTEY